MNNYRQLRKCLKVNVICWFQKKQTNCSMTCIKKYPIPGRLKKRWRNMPALLPEHWCIPTKVWFPSIKLRLAIGCYHEMKTIPMPKMCTSVWFPLLNRWRRNGLFIRNILHRKDMAICSVPKTIRFGQIISWMLLKMKTANWFPSVLMMVGHRQSIFLRMISMRCVRLITALPLSRALKLLQRQQVFLVRIISDYGITVMVSMRIGLLP